MHFKQKEAHIHVISDLAVQQLKDLKHYYEVIFLRYKYKYLFGKDKPIEEKYLINRINRDLKHTCNINEILYNIKSHSFRINMSTRLLQKTSVQYTVDIFICHSMSRVNTPKDNAVAERFMRTFKEHKIKNKTFQQELFHQIEINSGFRGYRKIFNLYVKDLVLKPNTNYKIMSPKRLDTDAQVASMLITKPNYSKAFSEVYRTDFRRDQIDQFKNENKVVTSILDEIAAKRSEIVDKTPTY